MPEEEILSRKYRLIVEPIKINTIIDASFWVYLVLHYAVVAYTPENEEPFPLFIYGSAV